MVGSSLTAVDLAGPTRAELGFALLLGASATGLFLVLGLTRRGAWALTTVLVLTGVFDPPPDHRTVPWSPRSA